MEGGDVSVEGKVTCASSIKRLENVPLVYYVHVWTCVFAAFNCADPLLKQRLFRSRLFELYGHEDNIKCVCKDFPLQVVGPQKCMAFSVNGSKLATGAVDGHFRLFEWPTMHIIVDEPKAHKSFRDMDFSICALALMSRPETTPEMRTRDLGP
ncbi:hypothetical protein KY284_012847 [Solanum tuberosum]|nr:hypothetical protein KY284_012847 [Solanum tuberosum]